MTFYFYLNARNEQKGPIAVDRFPQAGITPDTLVWTQGMETWERAAAVPELRQWFETHPTPTSHSDAPPSDESPSTEDNPCNPSANPQTSRQTSGTGRQQTFNSSNGGPSYGNPYASSSRPDQPYFLPCPPTYLVWAIFATLCCCLPLGIVAIVKASEVRNLYTRGLYDQALIASADAQKWCLLATVLGLVVQVIVFGAQFHSLTSLIPS